MRTTRQVAKSRDDSNKARAARKEERARARRVVRLLMGALAGRTLYTPGDLFAAQEKRREALEAAKAYLGEDDA